MKLMDARSRPFPTTISLCAFSTAPPYGSLSARPRTRDVRKGTAHSIATPKVASPQPDLSDYRCIDSPNVVCACGGFACEDGFTGGDTVPVCPAEISRRCPELHQKLVHRLPQHGQAPDHPSSALDGNRCRFTTSGGAFQRRHLQLSSRLFCRARTNGPSPKRCCELARVPAARRPLVCR